MFDCTENDTLRKAEKLTLIESKLLPYLKKTISKRIHVVINEQKGKHLKHIWESLLL
jgi:hypothetical protein